jgi:hypothetical protein
MIVTQQAATTCNPHAVWHIDTTSIRKAPEIKRSGVPIKAHVCVEIGCTYQSPVKLRHEITQCRSERMIILQIPKQRRNRTFPFEQNDVSIFAALYKPVIALRS